MATLRYAVAFGAAMLFAGSSADAQLRRTTTTTYPDAQSLPTGTCRIWIDGVPAANQPAPTDCATARRNQPRNSRIIYGTRQPTNVYGNRDPRSIPGTPQYDPRYDPRSSQYDPRLDPHNRGNNGRYGNNGNNGNNGRNDDKYDRKREREREKWERKQQKERDKAWKKGHKGNGRGDDDDDDDDDDDRRRNGQHGSRGNGRYGTGQQGCIDANRDGYCDIATSTQGIPRTIPQTIPQGTTRRVCVDANRDGRCDDGGPLVRTRP